MFDSVQLGGKGRGGAVDGVACRQHEHVKDSGTGLDVLQPNALIRGDLGPGGTTKREPVGKGMCCVDRDATSAC